MNSKLIQQYGEEILCYRLRTARQKKQMLYKDFDKQLIQLHKHERKLYEKKRNLGWEPLVPPVQKGWIRFFVLRDDVARNKHADFYQGILDKINTYQYCHQKTFLKKKRKFGRKIYLPKEQYLLRPCEYEFQRMQFSDAEKQCFYETWEYNYSKQLIKRYVFNELWRFVLKVKPNMIDKIRIKDAELESELQQIDNYMERNDYRKRLVKLLDGGCGYKRWKDVEKHTELNLYCNKSLVQTLDLIRLNY